MTIRHLLIDITRTAENLDKEITAILYERDQENVVTRYKSVRILRYRTSTDQICIELSDINEAPWQDRR